MESLATASWAIGRTGYFPTGYIPLRSLAKPKEERDEEPKRDIEEVFNEMVCYVAPSTVVSGFPCTAMNLTLLGTYYFIRRHFCH